MSSSYTCEACGELITNNLIIKDALPYHDKCIKCMIKGCNVVHNPEEFTTIQPGLFFCQPHYGQYRLNNFKLPPDVIKKYNEKSLKTLIDKTFDPPPVLKNSISVDHHTEIFLPTIEIHFDKEFELIDLEVLQEFIGEEFSIINAEKGSFITTIAYVDTKSESIVNDPKTLDTSKDITTVENDTAKDAVKPAFQKIKEFFASLKAKAAAAFTRLKEKFCSLFGRKKFGNMKNTIEKYPDAEKIQDFINNNSNNKLQVQSELNIEQFSQLINQASVNAKKNKFVNIFSKIKAKKILKKIVENSLYDKIRDCPFEVVIINKYFTEYPLDKKYDELRNKYELEDTQEMILFHGCYSDHEFTKSEDYIIRSNRLHLDGYYATNNIFYATFYGNERFHPLSINEKSLVSVVKAFYNKDYLQDIIPFPRLTYQSILKNNGAIHAYIKDSNKNFLPTDDANDNNSFAQDFIFGNPCQLQHLFTIEVIRRDYYVMWIDNEMKPDDKKMKKLKSDVSLNANVYLLSFKDDPLFTIRRKRFNRFKLIISENEETADLIISLREIFKKKKILVLVYSKDQSILNKYNKEEFTGVLATTHSSMIREYVKSGFDRQSLNKFIKKLEGKENFVFEYINCEEMSDFPLFTENIPFDENLTFNPE